MIITQSFAVWASAIALSGLGIFSQQPLVIGAGAGIAGGLGSVNLVRGRRKDEERVGLVRANSLLVKRLETLERTIDSLTDRQQQQGDRVECLVGDVGDVRSGVRELERTSKTQSTRLNLQVGAIQKLQQVSYQYRGTIAAQAAEIGEYQQAIADLRVVEPPGEIAAVSPLRGVTTHLLVDGNAMRFISKEVGKIDYLALREVLTAGAERVKCKFYLGDAGNQSQRQFITALERVGFEVLLFPIVNRDGGKQQTKGDDVQIAIDAVNVAPGDRVILCGGGDGDFVPVVHRLKEMGVGFTVVACEGNLAKDLKDVAGENLIYLSSIIDRIRLG